MNIFSLTVQFGTLSVEEFLMALGLVAVAVIGDFHAVLIHQGEAFLLTWRLSGYSATKLGTQSWMCQTAVRSHHCWTR